MLECKTIDENIKLRRENIKLKKIAEKLAEYMEKEGLIKKKLYQLINMTLIVQE